MKRFRFFGFPPKLRDKAAWHHILGTFGVVDALKLSEDGTSGTCTFSDSEKALLIYSALKGLKIGEYTIQVEAISQGDDESKKKKIEKQNQKHKRKQQVLEGKTPTIDEDKPLNELKKHFIDEDDKQRNKKIKLEVGKKSSESKMKSSPVDQPKKEVSAPKSIETSIKETLPPKKQSIPKPGGLAKKEIPISKKLKQGAPRLFHLLPD